MEELRREREGAEGAVKGDDVRAGGGERQQNWSGCNCRRAIDEGGWVGREPQEPRGGGPAGQDTCGILRLCIARIRDELLTHDR
jgi:hypothetical protein